METERINLLLNNPSEAKEDDIVLLENEISKSPFAQYLHILLARVQSELNSTEKQEKLIRAAIYSSNRAALKKVIQEKEFLENIEQIAPYQELPILESIDETEKKEKSLGDKKSKKSDSSSIFDEVLKNLKKLKSLRKQFQFLETNEPESVAEEKVAKKLKDKKTKKDQKPKTEKETTEPQETSHLATKEEKQNEILKKDEVLDSQVNVFFLKEIESKKSQQEHEETKDHISQNKIIEKFIEEQPSIGNLKKEQEKSSDEINKDLSEKSTKFGDDLVSENLAVILLKQGKRERAIDIYKKLIWKLPQKKAYFAARIEEIKK